MLAAKKKKKNKQANKQTKRTEQHVMLEGNRT